MSEHVTIVSIFAMKTNMLCFPHDNMVWIAFSVPCKERSSFPVWISQNVFVREASADCKHLVMPLSTALYIYLPCDT